MSMVITQVDIRHEQDIVNARFQARFIAEQLGFSKSDQTRISTAVSEISRNAFQYAGGGKIEFSIDTSGEPTVFAITVRDHGKGIPRPDEIPDGRFTPGYGKGHGITVSKRLMDHFHIDTTNGGTMVILGKNLPLTAPPVTPALIQRIADLLVKTATPDAFGEIQFENQDLTDVLEELNQRQEELAQINRELNETNRGVVALYVELDDKAVALKKLRDDLEQRVKERTSELSKANEGLVTAQKELHIQIEELAVRDKKLSASETQLRATLESTADGILAVDNKGKILQANRRFIELWGIPPSLMERGDDRALVDFVLDQLTDPDTFLKKVQSLYDSDSVNMDRIAFKDSRVFERYSSPMIMSGTLIGRVWSFRDITERNRMAESIETSLAEKKTLLKEIHHRVKNNLQIITSILNLQIRQEDDPTVIEALKDSQSRVRSMALVHEHLYRGKDFSHIDLGNYIRALGTGLFQSYEAAKQGIRFDPEIRDIYVDINTSIPLGLISNELITNSLKYAFKEKKEGKISIIATENPQALTFVVADDGAGMPEGITLENQTSLGLRLVSLLTGQLKGTVTIDRTEGTRFVFTIPKEPEQTPADRGLHTASSAGLVKEASGGITDPITAVPDKSGVNRE